MAQATGTARPGGRTRRTREKVHAAVRELLAAGGVPSVTIAEVAERSGVHQATIYRRWRTLEELVLDVAAAQLSITFPVRVTGDLRHDLTRYTRQLLESLANPGGPGLFRAMIAAASTGGAARIPELLGPRLDEFQTMLDAAGATELTPRDVVELVLSPVYMRALLAGAPGETPLPGDESDVSRIVGNVLAVQEARRA